jgi:hypothetical protein
VVVVPVGVVSHMRLPCGSIVVLARMVPTNTLEQPSTKAVGHPAIGRALLSCHDDDVVRVTVTRGAGRGSVGAGRGSGWAVARGDITQQSGEVTFGLQRWSA